MSETVHERKGKVVDRRKLAGAAAGVAIGLTISHTVMSVDVVAARVNTEHFLRSKAGPVCAPAFETIDMPSFARERAAHDCLDNQVGKVALVWFGLSDSVAATVAKESQTAMPDVFDGLLSPEVVPIQAPGEVARRFIDVNPNGCFADSNEDNYLAKVADQTMDLSEYTGVIGVSPYESCSGVLGVAMNNTAGFRYAAVTMSNKYGNDADRKTAIQEAAAVVEHEYGHLKGLDHASAFIPKDSGAVYFGAAKGDVYQYFPRTWKRNESYQLDAMIRDSFDYEEYGDARSRMGGILGTQLNSAERRLLLWPKIALGEVPDFRKVVNGGEQHVALPTDKQHDYAVLRLDTPVHVTGKDRPADFDELVFDPEYSDRGETSVMQVYLASSKNAHTASFGYIHRMNGFGKNPLTFAVGDQSVSVVFDTQGMSVRDTSK